MLWRHRMQLAVRRSRTMTITAEPQAAYGLSEEHEALRASVRDFAETVVAPRAAEVDRTATYPWDVHEALRKNDLLALHVPEAVRRRRRRRDLHGDRHRGAVARRRQRRSDRRGEQARHDRPAAVGQRGAQAALPARRRDRRGDVLVRAVRARGRARTPRRCARGRSATATTTSWTAPRPGSARPASRRTTRSWPSPSRASARAASRRSSCTPTTPASASARPSTRWASRARRPARSTSRAAASRPTA